MIDVDTPLPEYTGQGQVGILVGLQDVSLDPVLIGVLPSGLGVPPCGCLGFEHRLPWPPTLHFELPTPQEFGILLMIEGAEQLSTPKKTSRRKRRFRRRPCLCPPSPAGWGGSDQEKHRHRQRYQHQHQQQHQQQEMPRLSLGSRS